MDFFGNIFGKQAPTISAVELQEKIKTGKRPFVLDVRQPEEYREGHISGAKLIPLGDLKQSLKDLPKQREIICVCASGNRSSSAARTLMAEGLKVFNMQGGMTAWQRENLPIKKGMAA